jgi:hypothetical protein
MIQETAMDRAQQRFVKSILNMIMRSAIQTTLWRMPIWVVIALGVAAGGAMWYWKLF